MAYVHPHRNKYIFYNYLIDATAAVVYFSILLFAINNFLKYNLRQSFNTLGLIISFLLFAPLVYVIWRSYRTADQSSIWFSIGAGSEKKILIELQNLPENYSVYPHVKLPESYGDIDFIVIGNSCVFVIEVKSGAKGRIEFDGQGLTQNGAKLGKRDYLKQAKGGAVALHNYILDHLKLDLFITPIVVFANHVDIKFGKKKVANTFVISKPWLNQIIESENIGQPLSQREAIENILRELYPKE